MAKSHREFVATHGENESKKDDGVSLAEIPCRKRKTGVKAKGQGSHLTRPSESIRRPQLIILYFEIGDLGYASCSMSASR